MPIIGVYCIQHLASGRMYVGKSVNVEKRVRQHLRGEGRPGSPIEKMRAAKRGKPRSTETKAKLRAANLGKICSEETKAKHRAWSPSEEMRAKMSAAAKRRHAAAPEILERARTAQRAI